MLPNPSVRFVLGVAVLTGASWAEPALAQTLHDPARACDAPGGLFDPDSLRTLRLEFEDPDFDATLDARWLGGDGRRLPARLRFSDGTDVKRVGVRYKGNSTYFLARGAGNPKLPLNIELDAYDDRGALLGYTKLKLANGAFDPTLARETVAYAIYRRFLPSPEANLLRVFVNGAYLGVYVNTESVDKAFLRKHYGGDGGALFKGDPVQRYGVKSYRNGIPDLAWRGEKTATYYPHYTIRSTGGWTELRELIRAVALDSTEASLEAALNVDGVLWGFAVNAALVNLDTYNGSFTHNYYLYRAPDGRWQYVPWDVSEAWVGGFFNPKNPRSFYGYDPFYVDSSDARTLLRRILTTPDYRRRYAHHLRTVLERAGDPEDIRAQVANLQALSAESVAADPHHPFSAEEWRRGVDEDLTGLPESNPIRHVAGVVNIATLRREYLLAREELAAAPPTLEAPTLTERDGRTYVQVVAANAADDAGGVRLYTSPELAAYAGGFRQNPMRDDGRDGDAVAGDGVYTAPLDPVDGPPRALRYYVRADNAAAMATQPARAAYVFYRYVPRAADALVVNEVAASNDRAIADEAGEFDDWIELHNPTDVPVDAGGLSLTDDPALPAKWTLPRGTTVPAGGYLLVWADGEPEQGPLHASFKLSAGGEAVVLSRPDGEAVDGVAFGEQATDLTWGRLPDGTGPFAALAPTPGAANEAGAPNSVRSEAFETTAAPNPASAVVTLRYPTATPFGTVVVRLLDASGREVRSAPATGAGDVVDGNSVGVARLELGGVAAGMYIAEVRAAAELLGRTRVLVQP